MKDYEVQSLIGRRSIALACTVIFLAATPVMAKSEGAPASGDEPGETARNGAAGQPGDFISSGDASNHRPRVVGRFAAEPSSRTSRVRLEKPGYGAPVSLIAGQTHGSASIEDHSRLNRITVSRGYAEGPFLDFRERSKAAFLGGMPISGARLSSRFGMRYHPVQGNYRAHRGIDLAASAGTPVVATSDGIVSRAGWYGSYGLYVSLEHGGSTQSRYAHLSRVNVTRGQNVRSGDIIGFVGSTGRSTGPHLHYELRVDGMAVDPLLLGR